MATAESGGESGDASPPEEPGPGGRLFSFVQWEFPWALGPPDGRYVIREGPGQPPRAVLVLATLGAPERRRLRRRRSRPAEPEPDATPVRTARATVVLTDRPLADDSSGQAWLRRADARPADEAIATLNLAIRNHRLAAADPYVREVTPEQALVIRVGYGAGEQVADGRWTDARKLPPAIARRRPRTAALRPQERLAAMLGGRDAPLACEDLALRCRLDLDAGRHREAALQLDVALAAALVELGRDGRGEGLAERVAQLDARRETVAAAAGSAVEGRLDPQTAEVVSETLGRLEAALRARVATGSASQA